MKCIRCQTGTVWANSKDPRCTPCRIETRLKVCTTCGVEKSLDEFYPNKNRKDGVQSVCSPCSKSAKQEWYATGGRDRVRDSYYRKTYGISAESADEMLGRGCAICGEPASVIDHCHTKGHVRGALCPQCNVGLGNFRDDTKLLHLAIDYLS